MMSLVFEVYGEVHHLESLSKGDIFIGFDGSVEEFLLPFLIGSVEVESLECHSEGIITGREYRIFVADVNISDFDLEIVDDTHA